MSGPTRMAEAAIFEAEEHVATLSRLLEVLSIALSNAARAQDVRLVSKLDAEITYYVKQLAAARARRESLHQQHGG